MNGYTELTSFSKRIAEGVETGEQWRAVLDTDNHRMAMSAHYDKDNPCNVSIFIVDATQIDEEDVEAAQEHFNMLAEDINMHIDTKVNSPVRIAVSIAGTKTHGTKEGCDIFAIADAEDMLNNPVIEAIHQEALAKLRENREVVNSRLVNAISLGLGFYRLATNPKTLDNYLDVHPELAEEVQTLKDQQSAHLVDREEHDNLYSNMYEKERINLFSRLLSYQKKRERRK